MKRTVYLLVFVMLATAVACGPSGEPKVESSFSGETMELDDREDPADRLVQWKVRAPSMTLWMQDELQPKWSHGRTVWTFTARVSKNIGRARAYFRPGYYVTARRISPRKVTVVLSSEEAIRLLSGERLFFDFEPERGQYDRYHAFVRFKPGFVRFDGSPKIFVYRWINPIIDGGEIRFRGRVTTSSGYHVEHVFTDDDSDPRLSAETGRRWRFDFAPSRLILAADPQEDPVYFQAVDSADTRHRKRAHIGFRLVQLGLTVEDPELEWPADACVPEVDACLDALPDDVFDTESCGWASEVQACFGEVKEPLAATPDLFVEDLREKLGAYYDQYGNDILETGGNTLEDARDAVRVDRVSKVDDYEEGEYYPHDPTKFDVLYHPDVIFPGSARVWYGVYDQDGKKIALYAVN